jgi:hypothetical protein
MGTPTSSYATAGIALRVSGALKPHHHDKVETPSVGRMPLLMLFNNKELRSLYMSPGFIKVVSCRRVFWSGHITEMAETTGT